MIKNNAPHPSVVIGADYIISLMDYSDHNNLDKMIEGIDALKIIPTLTPEEHISFDNIYRDEIITFLHNNDYIERTFTTQDNKVYYKLSLLGKKVKRKEGHYKYIDFENRLETVPFKTLNWTKVATIAAITGVILTGISIKNGCNQQNQRSTDNTIKPIDSTKFDIKR